MARMVVAEQRPPSLAVLAGHFVTEHRSLSFALMDEMVSAEQLVEPRSPSLVLMAEQVVVE